MDDRPPVSPGSEPPLSTDVINAARIRVAGIGGLGLVAMAIIVAVFVPRIGQELALGATLGVVLAAILIAWRRRTGPLPTSGRSLGASTMLSIDDPASGDDDHEPWRPDAGILKASPHHV